jgi:hypothetical protein
MSYLNLIRAICQKKFQQNFETPGKIVGQGPNLTPELSIFSYLLRRKCFSRNLSQRWPTQN